MKFTIPKNLWSVLAVLLCLNVGTLMAQHHHKHHQYIQTWEWCCMETPVMESEECPPEEAVTPPPIQAEKPEPVVIIYEPMPEPVQPEPETPVVVVPEPAPVIEEVVVIEPMPTPEPQPILEKPLPTTASNWLTHLLAGFTLIALALGLHRRCAA